MAVRVWTVHVGYDATLICVCATEAAARAEVDRAWQAVAFADEWHVDGSPTGRKLLSKSLEDDE